MMIRKITKKFKFIILGSTLMPTVFVASADSAEGSGSSETTETIKIKVAVPKIKDNELFFVTVSKSSEERNSSINIWFFEVIERTLERKKYSKSNTDPNSKLQYKLKNDDGSNWKDVPEDGTIENPVSGEYIFRWKVKNNNEEYVDGNNYKEIKKEGVIISNKIPDPRTDLSISATNPNVKEAKGSIAVTNGEDAYSQLQYRKGSDGSWENVVLTGGKIEGLDPGTYNFQWVGKNDEQYQDGSTVKSISDPVTIGEANRISDPRTDLSLSAANPNVKGAKGSITITNGEDIYSQLQYQKEGDSDWKDVTGSDIPNLDPGTYNFQWVGKNDEQYQDGTTVKSVSGPVTIEEANIIAIPTTKPTFSKTDETVKGKNDGYIKVEDGTDTYSKLQYQKEGDSDWKDVPKNGRIKDLTPGTYNFQWVGKNDEQYEGGTSVTKKTIAKEINIDASDKSPVLVAKETSDDKTTLILAITIPTGLIFIVAIFLLIKYKPFKKLKKN